MIVEMDETYIFKLQIGIYLNLCEMKKKFTIEKQMIKG